jgi:ankyrin repeat protein
MRENGKEFAFHHDKSDRIDPDMSIELILRGNVEEFKELMMKYPQAVNLKERAHGNVPLHVAASKGDSNLVSFLIRLGAFPNMQDIFGNGPLHYATDKSKYATMELLVASGANPNLQDNKGNSPLHSACVNNDVDGVKVLLKLNADPELTDFADMMPRDKARSPMIRSLLDRRIHALCGGDEEQAAQSVHWMSFGVGLGVGVGMALAKFQQNALEQLAAKMMVDGNKPKRRGNFGSVANFKPLDEGSGQLEAYNSPTNQAVFQPSQPPLQQQQQQQQQASIERKFL